MKPFWITFYSYKGGVGRSLALANIAALLVNRGRRVALIDFDLEAPGLDSFEEFKCVASKPGVVEYVTEFKSTRRAPDISQFTHPCELPGPLRGKLWIMPAGKKDAAYNSLRANLHWVRLYDSGLGEPFVENWKAAIARHCQPDYVFVDSRTGLTDVAGICTLHLPDLVVMVFGLNDQNVKGIAAVAKTIRESESTRIPQLHYVASPLPNLTREKRGPLTKRLTAAASHLGVKFKSTLRYQAAAALNEKLFVLEDEFEASPLVEDYEDLLGRLIEYNRTGLDFLLKQTRGAISEVDNELKTRLLAVLRQEFPERAESLMAQAQLKKALGDSNGAIAAAREALEADPTLGNALDWLLDNYRRLRDFKAALSLCDMVLQHADRLSPHRRYNLHSERGHIAMAAGEYAAATESYSKCISHLAENKKKGDVDPELVMINMFNDCEANRRLSGEPLTTLWRTVLNLFKMTGDASAEPLVLQANRWQAMHIPFAMTGHHERAREALTKARQAAQLLGIAEDIFTVRTYTDVPVKEFLKNNDEMLAALDRGQLWDGMPLPTVKPQDESRLEGDPELEV